MSQSIGTMATLLMCWTWVTPAVAQIPVSRAERALLEATEPERNFFMKQLGGCPECQTLTIVVADDSMSAGLFEAFRTIAERLGKDNAGAVSSTRELWKHWKIFADHGCSGMEQIHDRYVLFVDRTGSFCVVFPFNSDRRLLGALEIIESSLRDRDAVDPEKWRYVTTSSIERYLKRERGIEPFRAGALALVNHFVAILPGRR